jgi:DUF1009 family protein
MNRWPRRCAGRRGFWRADPARRDQADAARAAAIVAGLGALDVGQGAVVAQGLCLGVEALPGTDAMLDSLPGCIPVCGPIPRVPTRGVLQGAEAGQDRRIDLPTMGPETVAQVAAAGLGGIVWEAGGVILLEREAAVAAARDAGPVSLGAGLIAGLIAGTSLPSGPFPPCGLRKGMTE